MFFFGRKKKKQKLNDAIENAIASEETKVKSCCENSDSTKNTSCCEESTDNTVSEVTETTTTNSIKDDSKAEDSSNTKKNAQEGVQHVTRHPDGGWQVKGSGNKRATIRTKTQAEAIEIAKKIAENKGTSYRIHKKDGKIRKTTYNK